MLCKTLLLVAGLCPSVCAQLVLQKTEQTRQVLGEKGMEASTVLEVRASGKPKPLYTLRVEGVDGRIVNDEMFVVSRGLEDVDWWSVFRLADGKPLFDTHVPVVQFPGHYAGLDVPSDDDPRLEDGRLIGIVSIATSTGKVRRVELRCGDLRRARLLRSYWDVQRSFTFVESKRSLLLSIRGAAPDVAIKIPLAGTTSVQACDIVAR